MARRMIQGCDFEKLSISSANRTNQQIFMYSEITDNINFLIETGKATKEEIIQVLEDLALIIREK